MRKSKQDLRIFFRAGSAAVPAAEPAAHMVAEIIIIRRRS